MMLWHDGWGAGDWLAMGFIMLSILALVVGGVVWLVQGSLGPSVPPADRARQVLDERFARGELTEDEYRQRRDTLYPR